MTLTNWIQMWLWYWAIWEMLVKVSTMFEKRYSVLMGPSCQRLEIVTSQSKPVEQMRKILSCF